MFLYRFDAAQKASFLALAHHLVSSETRFNDRAAFVFGQLKREMGLPEQSPPAYRNVRDAGADFSSRRDRWSAMIELLAISLSDCDDGGRDSIALAEIRDALGLTEVDVVLMKNWVIRLSSLMREAADLMEQDA